MAYNFQIFKEGLSKVEVWFKNELATVRTGRASTSILDNVMVEVYGSQMPINQVASITLEDPKTIRISPWDTGVIKDIEKAFLVADLGLSISSDGKGVRVSFPDLTSERRELLVKQSYKKLEEARISVRKEREDVWNDIQDKEKNGQISEDDKFRAKDELQKIVDECNKKLEIMAQAKEKEILE